MMLMFMAMVVTTDPPHLFTFKPITFHYRNDNISRYCRLSAAVPRRPW
jgi:hypothetical protein